MSGTADDSDGPGNSNSGVEEVYLRIKKFVGSSTYYWTSTQQWEDGVEDWILAVGQNPWTFSNIKDENEESNVNKRWESGRRYGLISRAEDWAGNVESDLVERNFYYDLIAPTSTITSPSSGQYFNESNLPLFKGLTRDEYYNLFNSGMDAVEVRIYDIDKATAPYYDDSVRIWKTTDTWNSATLFVSSWSYTVDYPSDWDNNHQFRINARGIDNVSNTEITFSTVTITVDKYPGSADVSAPADLSEKNNVPQISGTSQASPAPPVSVYLKIKDDTLAATKYYWDGSTWTTNVNDPDTWLSVNGTASWDYGITYQTNTWKDGHKYFTQSKVLDAADNISDPGGSGRVFFYDIKNPAGSASNPSNASYMNSVSEISGTSTDSSYPDPYRDSGVSDVKIQVVKDKDGPSQAYWSGSGWGGSPAWVNAKASDGSFDGEESEAWNYGVLKSTWFNDGYVYTVRTRVWDEATNNVSDVNAAEITFTFDSASPATAVNWPKDGEIYTVSLSTFAGEATKTTETPIQNIQFSLLNKDTTKYYQQAGNWLAPRAWLEVSTATQPDWVFDITDIAFISGDEYELAARSVDLAGNMDMNYSTVTFTYDDTGPLSQITVPSDAAVLNYLLKLEGTAADVPAGVDKVEVYIHDYENGNYWNGVNFIPTEVRQWVPVDAFGWQYSGSWEYTGITNADWFGNGDCRYRINCRGTDEVGNVGVFGSTVSITYDATEPNSGIINPSSEGAHLNVLNAISGTAYDAMAGIEAAYLKLRIKRNSDGYSWAGSSFVSTNNWKTVTSLTPDTTKWTYTTLPAWGSGESYILNIQAKDNAVNWETDFTTRTFVFDNTGPDSYITAPVDTTRQSPGRIEGASSDATGSVAKVELRI